MPSKSLHYYPCSITMASTALLYTLLWSIILCSFSASSTAAKTRSRPTALLLPVTKDQSTSQYITQIYQKNPSVPEKLTLDLGGQSLWVDCDKGGYLSSTYKPVHCNSSLCALILKTPLGCGECYGSPKPGCNNHSCSVFPSNTLTHLSTVGELAKDAVSLQSTDGSNPGSYVSVPRLVFTCGAKFLRRGLAKGVKGMAGLGRSYIGLPSQLSHAFRFPRMFAICLSSSTGVVFFGDGPYVMLPGIDISKRLTYTPLVINPIGADGIHYAGQDPYNEYFIGVTAIKINSKLVPINRTMMSINKETGLGGTKFSTVVPYTVLERSIYNAVTNAFITSLSKVPRVKPLAPFKACYNSKSLGSTRVGPGVPPIELVLHNERVSWTFFGANSMVQVSDEVLCLGFVDGGLDPSAAIVIGGHQLENAILQFDLGRSMLGFTSTILGRQTTCANFNFTSKA